ncbi:MAG: beta strand repeat-containing protein [Opitutaceae bacterium]
MMKTNPKTNPLKAAITSACLLPLLSSIALAQSTWDGAPDGGGSSADANWSTGDNWLGDTAPTATGDYLIFDGTTGLINTNDIPVTALGDGAGDPVAITFNAGAGAFNLGGATSVTMGDANGGIIIQNDSPNDQEISFPIQLPGGNKTRTLNTTGGGRLVLSGDITGANDFFNLQNAGTYAFTGNNTGAGKGQYNSNGNIARMVLQIDTTGQTLQLGSSTALFDPSVAFGDQRSVRVRQTLNLEALTDLTGANAVNNSFFLDSNSDRTLWIIGSNDIEIGGVCAAFNGTHQVRAQDDAGASLIIGGHGLMLANGNIAKNVQTVNDPENDITISGPIHDTFDANGILTQTDLGYGGLTDSQLRKEGTGLMTISADNSTTFNGTLRIGNGTVKLGHPNALGGSGATPFRIADVDTLTADVTDTSDTITGDFGDAVVAIGDNVAGTGIDPGTVISAYVDEVSPTADTITLSAPATATNAGVSLAITRDIGHGTTGIEAGAFLDLNGQTTAEVLRDVSGTIINSNTSTTAELTSEMVQLGNPTFGGAGDIIVDNIRRTTTQERRITKNGAGTLTLGGDVSNNRYGLTVDEGNVILAKTSGEAVNRYALIINDAASTVTLTLSDEQITDAEDQTHQLNAGTLDLNGFSETIGQLTGTAGIVTNTGGSTSTFTLANSNADVVFDGTLTGDLNLIKSGSSSQTLNGDSSYTGYTQINAGTLKVGHVNALGTSIIGGANASFTGTLDVNGFAIANAIEDKIINGGTITNTGVAVDLSSMGDFGASATRSFNVDGTGDITFGQVIFGNYSIVKNGANTLTLSGVNTYNGSTTVNAGTLALNGTSLSDSSSLIIDGGDVAVTGTETVSTLFFGAVQQNAGDYTVADNAAITSGTITVLNGPAPADPYDAWAAANGLTGGDEAATADPDGDGENLYEYFFWDSDPNTAEVFGSELTAVPGSSFAFKHDRPLDLTGVTVTYQWTTDLTAGWTDDGASDGTYTVTFATGTTGAPANGNATDYQSVEVTPSVTGGTPTQVFVRVSVTKP